MEKGGKKMYVTEMEEAPENGKELSHSAHVNGMNELTLRRLMSYIYGAPILDVSSSHTMTQHSR